MTHVAGTCSTRFDAVRKEFERNFAERGEIGASVCVMLDGERVVDLHGGVADPVTSRPWTADTVGVVWSSTKGAMALCAHLLADRGELDFDAPVARYWPEFARAGKERLTVRMVLNHQAGLPVLRAPLPPGGLYDWQRVIAMLEQEEPFWEPGTRHGYHAMTIGYLVGEVVRRVTGQTLGTFFEREVARPLGIDFWIGLPESEEGRVARNIAPDRPANASEIPPFLREAFADPRSVQALLIGNSGGHLDPGACNARAAHAAELPAMGGITDARGLAGMYAPLSMGGSLGGVRLVSDEAIAAMSAVQSAVGVDAVLLQSTRFSLGFMKSADNRRHGREGDSALLPEDAFGHVGMGGSIGFADPRAGLSFGYMMNKQGPGILLNARGQRLIDAVYQALGYRAHHGTWLPPRKPAMASST